MKEQHTYAGKWIQNWYDIFVNELKQIFSDDGAMLIFFFAGLLYPLLYNYIYRNGLVEDMPVAVVNMSKGDYSRKYLQGVDATREVEIDYNCIDMAEAELLMQKQKVHGIIYIPKDFDENIITMRDQAFVSTYADMSSLMYYKNLTVATNLVMLDEVHKIQIEHYAENGESGETIMQDVKPMDYDENILYNPALSYSVFFIYAMLLLVVQQTMFYGSTLLAGTMREQNRSFASMPDKLQGLGMGRVVLGRGAAYFVIYIVIATYIACFVPWLFHLPARSTFLDLFVLMLFFVTACIFFCFTWSSFFRRRETVLVVLLSMTPIIIFLTGFAWPQSNMPGFWRIFSYIFPSTFGIRAFINLNGAGGNLSTVSPEIAALTIQIIIYYLLACAAVLIENKLLKQRKFIFSAKEKLASKVGIDLEKDAELIGGEEAVERYRKSRGAAELDWDDYGNLTRQQDRPEGSPVSYTDDETKENDDEDASYSEEAHTDDK